MIKGLWTKLREYLTVHFLKLKLNMEMGVWDLSRFSMLVKN